MVIVGLGIDVGNGVSIGVGISVCIGDGIEDAVLVGWYWLAADRVWWWVKHLSQRNPGAQIKYCMWKSGQDPRCGCVVLISCGQGLVMDETFKFTYKRNPVDQIWEILHEEEVSTFKMWLRGID